MPTMPELVSQPVILKRLDKLSEDATWLVKFRTALAESPADLATIAFDHQVLVNVDEVMHIRNDWCFAWWPKAQPLEQVLRKGLIVAIDVALREPEAADDRPQHLPLCSFWNCDPGHLLPQHEDSGDSYQGVAVSVCWNSRQVTLTFHTPDPPYPDHTFTGKEAIYVIERDPQSGSVVVVRP